MLRVTFALCLALSGCFLREQGTDEPDFAHVVRRASSDAGADAGDAGEPTAVRTDAGVNDDPDLFGGLGNL